MRRIAFASTFAILLLATVSITSCGGGGGGSVLGPQNSPTQVPTPCAHLCLAAEYQIPTANSQPLSITAGPDGNVWFTEASKIGRITAGGAITEYPIPSGDVGSGSIISGPGGNLWFAEGDSKIGEITPAGSITEFPVPKQPGSNMTVGADNNLWFAASGSSPPLGYEIEKMTPAGVIAEYTTGGGGQPGLLATGSDGNVWIVLNGTSEILRMSTSGVRTNFPFPSADFYTDMAPGPGGLWITDFSEVCSGLLCAPSASGIVNFSPAGLPTVNFPLVAYAVPQDIAKGPDGNMWFTAAGSIGRITPSGVVTYFELTSHNPQGVTPFAITAGPDGNMWFTDVNAGMIGKFVL